MKILRRKKEKQYVLHHSTVEEQIQAMTECTFKEIKVEDVTVDIDKGAKSNDITKLIIECRVKPFPFEDFRNNLRKVKK